MKSWERSVSSGWSCFLSSWNRGFSLEVKVFQEGGEALTDTWSINVNFVLQSRRGASKTVQSWWQGQSLPRQVPIKSRYIGWVSEYLTMVQKNSIKGRVHPD